MSKEPSLAKIWISADLNGNTKIEGREPESTDDKYPFIRGKWGIKSFLSLTEYGYVAEEAIKHTPELVVLDDEGRPDSFQYSRLIVPLLAEVKKQRLQIWILFGCIFILIIANVYLMFKGKSLEAF